MKYNSHSPQVEMLRAAVESSFGQSVKTPFDFANLASAIEGKTRQHISDSTLKRVWNYSTSYNSITPHILEVLSRFADFQSWAVFCDHLSTTGQLESDIITGEYAILTSELHLGNRLLVSWPPDRECVFEYCGDERFITISSKNSKLCIGDTFLCRSFMQGRPLYVDDLCHGDEVFPSYGMGMEHGITELKLLSDRNVEC